MGQHDLHFCISIFARSAHPLNLFALLQESFAENKKIYIHFTQKNPQPVLLFYQDKKGHAAWRVTFGYRVTIPITLTISMISGGSNSIAEHTPLAIIRIQHPLTAVAVRSDPRQAQPSALHLGLFCTTRRRGRAPCWCVP